MQMELSERPLGVFSRQIVLADTLDTEHIKADYDAGVLTLPIAIAERAKPRKISISGLAWVSPASAGEKNASRARRRGAPEFAALVGDGQTDHFRPSMY